eukprot:1385900-Prymnesium_polylepis.1
MTYTLGVEKFACCGGDCSFVRSDGSCLAPPLTAHKSREVRRRLRSEVSAEALQQLQKKANRLSNTLRFWALGRMPRIAHHHFPEYTQKVLDPAEPPKVFGLKWLMGGYLSTCTHGDASGSAPLLKMVVYAAKALSYMGLLSSNHSRIVDELHGTLWGRYGDGTGTVRGPGTGT